MLVHPQFDPVALQLGPLAIHWYGLMYLAGFIAFLWLGRKRIATFNDPRINTKLLDDLLFYGVLGAMLVSKINIWRWRVFIVFTAIALVTLVSLSRVYLGVHYFSDVLAAFAEAVAWLSLCLMGTHTYFRLRAESRRKENLNVST